MNVGSAELQPQPDRLRQILIHPALRETVDAMRRIGVRLPADPSSTPPPPATGGTVDGIKVVPLEELKPVAVDARRGRELNEMGIPIFAYDESIAKYAALEGNAQFTAHAIITPSPDQYLPILFVSAYFYTKSKEIGRAHASLRYSDDPNIEAQKDYIRDRMELLRQNVPPGSILLIDGPLIAGDVYTTFLPFIEQLHAKDIVPVFIVKNSESSLVLDAVPAWRDKYNSDLHWAHRFLHVGERSPFFGYRDLHNPRNSKVFAYLRAVENSPMRVELHSATFERYKDRISGLFDLCFFQVLVQGSQHNPQPRSIAVAEMYAREALKMLDVQTLMRRAHLVPTMNQVRFGSA